LFPSLRLTETKRIGLSVPCTVMQPAETLAHSCSCSIYYYCSASPGWKTSPRLNFPQKDMLPVQCPNRHPLDQSSIYKEAVTDRFIFVKQKSITSIKRALFSYLRSEG